MSNKPPKEHRELSRRQLKKAAKKIHVDPWVYVGHLLKERNRRGRACIRKSWIKAAKVSFIHRHNTERDVIVFARAPYCFTADFGIQYSGCTVKQLDACKNRDDFVELVETQIAITRLMQ